MSEEEFDPIYSIAVCKGKVLTGSTDEVIRAYDAETRRIVSTFTGHWSSVAMLSAMAGRPWESETAAVRFLNYASRHGACLLLRDGKVIYQLVKDDVPQIKNLASGEVELIPINDEERVTAIAEVENETVALGTSSSNLYIWNSTQGLRLVGLIGHNQRISSMATIRPNTIATGASDGSIRLWTLGVSRHSHKSTLAFVSDSPVMALEYCSPQHVLVAGDASGHLHWLQLPESLRS